MKKIISALLLVVFVSTNFSFGLGVCNPVCNPLTQKCTAQGRCVDKNAPDPTWSAVPRQECITAWGTYSNNTCTCPNLGIYNSTSKKCVPPPASCSEYNVTRKASTEAATCWSWYQKDGFSSINGTTYTCCRPGGTTTAPTDPVMGISCNEEQLVNGQCKLNIYDTLGIRKSVRNTGDPTSVGLFVQDVVLSATFFIGTLVTVALIVSGLMFIFAASSGKDPANAKKGIMGSLVGLLIVVSSYVIIRLIQYIAKGF